VDKDPPRLPGSHERGEPASKKTVNALESKSGGNAGKELYMLVHR